MWWCFCVSGWLSTAQTATRHRPGDPPPKSSRAVLEIDFVAPPPISVEDLLKQSILIAEGRVVKALPAKASALVPDADYFPRIGYRGSVWHYLTYCPAGAWVGKARVVESGAISFPPHAHGSRLTPLNGLDIGTYLPLIRQKIAQFR